MTKTNLPTHGKTMIRKQLATIPNLPGIYRMLSEAGEVLYIGKANNLRNRLGQYTQELSTKNEAMIARTCRLEYEVTESESAALLLEAHLIKRFKPKFNILLKDDKAFPYIKLRLDHAYPQLLKYRGRELQDGKFFGPFTSTAQVDITLDELQKIFRLRSCSDNYFNSRTRPCLQYQIKRCGGPCVNKISEEEYQKLVKQVQDFLSGKSHKLQQELAEAMERHAEKLEFEQAAQIRDRITALSYIQLKGGAISRNLRDVDIIAACEKNGVVCIQLALYRSGQPCGSISYYPQHTEGETINRVLESFLLQFYSTKKPASEIFLSDELPEYENDQPEHAQPNKSEKPDKGGQSNKNASQTSGVVKVFEELLFKLYATKVKILIPKKGWRLQLIDNAKQNAEVSLQQHLLISAKNIAVLQEVQNLFSLSAVPRRIEIYDNSHIQGAFAVGAMVVAGPEGFEKKEYRLYNIKESNASKLIEAQEPAQKSKSGFSPKSEPEFTPESVFGGDDYKMLKEVMTRRLKRLKNEPERRPDLLIIDGGAGHLGVVLKVMQELNTSIPFVCMSKGPERHAGLEQFHVPSQPAFTLDKNLPIMKYLQILRDEAHNFVINSHRKKRSKAIRNSVLEDIENIGNKRKKALLNYFGSVSAIKAASIDEITKVDGISKDLAEIIFSALRQ